MRAKTRNQETNVTTFVGSIMRSVYSGSPAHHNHLVATFAARIAPSSSTNKPAIAALLSVLKIPVISALTANPATSPVLPGAICESTPICVPREPMFPKPQRLYVAMSFERSDISV
jgi:hypothetical protein